LSIQARVNPDQPYFLEHSEWIKPYAAGFYAWKYLNDEYPKDGILDDPTLMDELLSLERMA